MMYCMDAFRHEADHGSSPVGSVPGGIRCPSDATCSTRDGSSAQEWQSIGACLFFNGSWHLEKWSSKIQRFWGERWNKMKLMFFLRVLASEGMICVHIYEISIDIYLDGSKLFWDRSYPSRRVDRRLAGGVVKKLGWIKGAACFFWWGERMQMWSMERCRKTPKTSYLSNYLIADLQ